MTDFKSTGVSGRIVVFAAAALLLALALARFAYQDMLRLAYPVNDLTTPWVATQAFLHGKDPYGDMQEFVRIWAKASASQSDQYRDYSAILSDLPMAYPPTALALIAPLGLFDWHTAVHVYVFGSLALFLIAVFLLARNLPLAWRDPRKLYFVAFALAMAPLHTGSQMANLNTLTIALLCIGLGLMSRRPCWSGIAIAVALCLKPQVAILFFAYMWLRKKWKTALTALATCTIISACTLTWLAIHHLDWLKSYQNELSRFSASGGANSSFAAGTVKFQLLSLQSLTFQFTDSRQWSAILAWTVFGLLAGTAIYLIHKHVSDENESTGVAIVAVLTLLPVYQRFYTAAILLLVVYWAVENWSLKSSKAAVLLMLPLLFPFVPWLVAYAGVPMQLPLSNHASTTTRIALVAERFVRDHNLSQSLIWNGFVLAHVIWIELILLVILLASLRRPAMPSDGRGANARIAELVHS